MVVQVPPGVLGMIDDAYFRYVTDVGLVGPGQGQGRQVPAGAAGLQGRAARGGLLRQQVAAPTATSFIVRAFVKDGDVAAR